MDVQGDNDEGWLRRLKSAYEAGYYRTEADEDRQEPFPWQNRTCGDCPFWMQEVCLVHGTPRRADAHTCRYYDRPWREEGRALMRRRRWDVLRRLPY